MTSFLEREIAEQPDVAARLLDRLLPRLDELRAHLTGRGAEQVLLVARGSSDNAARYAQYLWQTGPGVTVTLAAPSLTTVYAQPLDLRRHAVVAVSQSGRSPDVVAVVEQARAAGRPTLAVTNDPASPLAGAAELVLDLGAGEERSVAATKTYTSSVLALAVLGSGPQPDVLVVGLPAAASLPGWLTPLTSVVLGQQVAWRTAVRRGVDVDRPGDLSKVTLTR